MKKPILMTIFTLSLVTTIVGRPVHAKHDTMTNYDTQKVYEEFIKTQKQKALAEAQKPTREKVFSALATPSFNAAVLGWIPGYAYGAHQWLYNPSFKGSAMATATKAALRTGALGLLAAPLVYKSTFASDDSYTLVPNDQMNIYIHGLSRSDESSAPGESWRKKSAGYWSYPAYTDELPKNVISAAGGLIGATTAAGIGIIDGASTELYAPHKNLESITRSALKNAIRRIPGATVAGVVIGTIVGHITQTL